MWREADLERPAKSHEVLRGAFKATRSSSLRYDTIKPITTLSTALPSTNRRDGRDTGGTLATKWTRGKSWKNGHLAARESTSETAEKNNETSSPAQAHTRGDEPEQPRQNLHTKQLAAAIAGAAIAAQIMASCAMPAVQSSYHRVISHGRHFGRLFPSGKCRAVPIHAPNHAVQQILGERAVRDVEAHGALLFASPVSRADAVAVGAQNLKHLVRSLWLGGRGGRAGAGKEQLEGGEGGVCVWSRARPPS